MRVSQCFSGCMYELGTHLCQGTDVVPSYGHDSDTSDLRYHLDVMSGNACYCQVEKRDDHHLQDIMCTRYLERTVSEQYYLVAEWRDLQSGVCL